MNKFYSIGVKKYNKGDLKGAVKAYTKAIDKNPSNAYIYCERGVAYYHLNEVEFALEDMNKARELQPDNPYRYAARAFIKEQMGDLEGAIEDYKVTIKLDPEDAIAHNNLAILEEKKGYKEQARKRIKRADKLAEAKEYLHKQQNSDTGNLDDPVTSEKAGVLDYFKFIKQIFTSKKLFNEYLSFIRSKFHR